MGNRPAKPFADANTEIRLSTTLTAHSLLYLSLSSAASFSYLAFSSGEIDLHCNMGGNFEVQVSFSDQLRNATKLSRTVIRSGIK